MSRTFDFYELIFHGEYEESVIEESTAPDRDDPVFKALVEEEVKGLLALESPVSYVYKVIYYGRSHYKISLLKK